MDNSRIKDLATLMPWVGLFLLTPPVLFLFHPGTTIFGIPVLPVYLFVMWFILILTSRKLTEHLVDDASVLKSSALDDPDHPSPTFQDEA